MDAFIQQFGGGTKGGGGRGQGRGGKERNEGKEGGGGNGFDAAAFSPGYGLAEHTVYVTDGGGTRFKLDRVALADTPGRRAPGDLEVIGCGVPTPGVDVVVVDVETKRRCAPDVVGEIWVRSASVAMGYVNESL
jgi:acyl-CoA synthetase (AMP-forming)/AMP-acid ligase II